MTLVELMISMLILTLVCVAWLEIIGIQSAKKEARRREAVERLAGMMDAFMQIDKVQPYKSGLYRYEGGLSFKKKDGVHPMFESEVSPIGYQLHVGGYTDLPEVQSFGFVWGNKCRWLVGRLYNSNGSDCSEDKKFFTLPVCLGLEVKSR